MSQIEIVAAVFGFLCVALYIARSDWSWPTGLVQVLLYISVFWQAKLYADMILHCLYVVLQIYGWWAWASARRTDVSQPTIRPRQLGLRGHVLCLAITTAQTLLFASLLSRWTDAQSPLADSFVASASLVAQCLLAWRYIENWGYWLAVNTVGVCLFASRGLIPTAILYGLFWGMAIVGFWSWYVVMRQPATPRRYEVDCP